jgi:hypothetical protein
MNIQYKASSVLHKIDSEPFKTKEELMNHYRWAEDLVVSEIDVDNEEYILRDVPKELHSSFSWMAYEKGHAYGQDEVVSHLKGLVDDLLPAILAYGTRVKKEK